MNKWKLVDLDNKESYGVNHIDDIDFFEFNGSVFYFSGMRSSKVRQITINEDEMIVQTKNSTYTFKKQWA